MNEFAGGSEANQGGYNSADKQLYGCVIRKYTRLHAMPSSKQCSKKIYHTLMICFYLQ